MSKTILCFSFIFQFAFVLALTANNDLSQTDQRPNFLVVLSDDHSAPFVGAYGDPNAVTPNLDKFASEGIIFRRAYVSSPQCVPSRAGIFASRSPVGIGMTRFSAAFPANVKSYPEYLRENGYFTGLAGRTYHMEGYNGKGDVKRNAKGELEYYRFADRFDHVKTGRGTPLEQFSEFLDSLPTGKPFYLQLCSSDPHRPYDGKKIPNPRDPSKLVLPSWFPDTPEVRKDLAGYYDEINRFDDFFGNVLSELERRSLKDNTVIIFLGDNGGDILRGKGTLYELGIHVPLIVRWANHVKPGTNSNALISAEDIGSTLLNIAGIALPEEWTSQSFLPILQGEKDAPQRKSIFSVRGAHGHGLPNNAAAFDLGRTIVGKRYKLIYNALWQIPYTPMQFRNLPVWEEIQEAAQNGKVPESLVPYFTGESRKMFELYDLQNDPDELKNLIENPEYAEIQRELLRDLTEWMTLERDDLPLPYPHVRQVKSNTANIVPDTEPGVKLLFDFTKDEQRILDSSGKKNTFVADGALKFVTKDGYSARYFDGNSYIDVDKSPALHCAGTPWSVEVKILAEKPDGAILSYGGTGNGYSLFLKDGKPGFAVRTGGQVFIALSETSVEGSVTLKGTITPEKKAELYVNGQKSASVVLPNFIAANPVRALQIGSDEHGFVSGFLLPDFKGWIQRIEIKRISP
jgi:arylsulfatase A-like enzyme